MKFHFIVYSIHTLSKIATYSSYSLKSTQNFILLLCKHLTQCKGLTEFFPIQPMRMKEQAIKWLQISSSNIIIDNTKTSSFASDYAKRFL